MKLERHVILVVLLISACAAADGGGAPRKGGPGGLAGPAGKGNQGSQGRTTAMITILDGVKPFWNMDAGPIFKAADIQAIQATPNAEDELLALIRDQGQSLARRFAAVEALAQAGFNRWRQSAADSTTIAQVLAAAIPQDKIHNRWGLPGNFLGRTGEFLLGVPHGVD